METEPFKTTEGTGGEAVAAALVARERRLVDEGHAAPGAG
jgi:hypothetical protein